MLSEKPWKPEAVVMLGAGILLSLAAGVLLGQLLGNLVPSRAMPDRTFYNFLISTLSFQGAVPFLLHQFLRYHQVGWREFFGLAAARPKRRLLLAAIAGGLVVPMVLSLNWAAQWLMTALHLQPVEQDTIRVLQVSVGWGQRLCFELIQRLTRSLPANESVIAGAGDDCAVLDLGLPDRWVLFKTDAVVEGIHFDRSAAPEKIGRKALARCLSDVAAMAGTPTAALITLGLPKDFEVSSVEAIYTGMNTLARQHQIAIAGGETTTNPERVFLSIALIGTVLRD